MSGYIDHLERVSNSRSFERKIAYLEHNFGRLFLPGQTALEIGPGFGEFLAFGARRRLSAVDVIDRDPGVLEIIQSRFCVRNAWNASAESLQDLEPSLPSYDRIVLFNVLEHVAVPALVPLVSLLFRRLEAGGKLIATVPNGANPLGVVERYSDLTHCGLFSPNSLLQLVDMAKLPEAFEVEVAGYRIPPTGPLNWARIVVQRTLHLGLLALMIANGGVFSTIYNPNISLIVTKKG